MKKLIATLIILLLAGWICLPGCSSKKTHSSVNQENKPTETTSESTGTNESIEACDESEIITISIPKAELKGEKKSKLILITKSNGEWQYSDLIWPSFINVGWILLIFVAVFSLVVNCIMILIRKGQ